MQGYQLTFFTEQNRKHGHQSICDWLLKFAEQHGASGGTLMSGAEGFDHAGKFHSAGFFELADQPLAITISVDEKACQRLMNALAEEGGLTKIRSNCYHKPRSYDNASTYSIEV